MILNVAVKFGASNGISVGPSASRDELLKEKKVETNQAVS